MKRIGIVPRSVLVDAALPDATATYTVISHGFIINSILQTLSAKGFVVTKERYTCNENAQVATGAYHITFGNDPDLGMLFAFSNSYNKLLRFRCAVGAFVKVNEMSVLGETGNAWVRKHTGTADDETLEIIEKQIDDAAIYFNQLAEDKETMKQIKLTQRQYAELLGRLYIDTKILSGEQLGVVKKEFEKPSYAYTTEADSLWTLYNHILVALSKSHPRTWMEQQKVVHMHLMTEYELTIFDDDDTILPSIPTNQLNIIDAIEEVETSSTDISTSTEVVPEAEADTDETEVSQQEEKEATVEEVVEPIEAEVEAIEESIEEPVAEIVEEVKEEPAVTQPTEAPRPKMTVEAAIEKYGHMLTADELEKLKKLDKPTVAKMKQIITDELEKESAVTVASDKLPGTGLPAAPVQKEEKAIEDTVAPIENAVEDTVDEVEDVIDSEPFFITKNEIDEMYPGVDLEAGFIVTLGDDDFEIISITDTQYELVALSSDVTEAEVDEIEDLDAEDDAILDAVLTPIPHVPTPEISLSERREAINAEIATQNAAKVDAFESEGEALSIGDPIQMASAENMLRKPTAEEARVDEVIAIIESKPSITEEDRKIQKAIAAEILDLYDEAIDFTYTLNNGQYSVKLVTDEIIVLTEPYINNLIMNQ